MADQTNRWKRFVTRFIGALVAGMPAAGALGWIGYSRLCIPHNMPLPSAVPAERHERNGRTGRFNYYAAGVGPPLLLVHSINAAASVYEIRPLFEHYRHTRSVYALDLPGFGFSDRSPRHYTPRLYTDAILDMTDVIQDIHGGDVDALALSLSSEFLARAASEQPGRFRTLGLVTPTGFGEGQNLYGPPGSTRGVAWVRRVLEFPLWRRAFFDLLNTRSSQRYFLKKTFGDYGSIDSGLLAYDYATAHQPGAEHAPYAFISGTLFSADIGRVYDSLQMPVWLAYGLRDEFTDFGGIIKVISRENWHVQPFETGGLPHFEQLQAFAAAYDAFLDADQVE
jgi:pimeloyl-ACP methyl ester carboxylesterase